MKRPVQLDRRIEIWTPTITRDGFGDNTVSEYALLKRIWAHFNPDIRIGRFEGEQDRQIIGTSTVLFTIRYTKVWKPTNKDQIRFEGVTYEIQNVQPSGRQMYFLVQAKERGEND